MRILSLKPMKEELKNEDDSEPDIVDKLFIKIKSSDL